MGKKTATQENCRAAESGEISFVETMIDVNELIELTSISGGRYLDGM